MAPHPALALLQEEFSDPSDLAARRKAAARLPIVSKAMGPERTCGELFPAVAELITASKEQDDVLYSFVRSLEKIADGAVGTSNPAAFFGPLEVMASVEETTVRDRAIALAARLAKRMTPAQVQTVVFPLLKRLAEAEWFTPRRSACGLFVPVYTTLEPSHRGDVLETFNLLVNDETPMVRKAVASAIGGMAHAKGSDPGALFATWKTLTDDAHVSVRFAAVAQTAQLAVAFGKDKAAAQILPHFVEVSQARGWRSRLAAAGQLGALAGALPASTAGALLAVVVALCRDAEEDVVDAALAQLPGVAAALKAAGELPAFVAAVVPVLEKIVCETPVDSVKPTTPRVRRTVSRVLLDMSALDPAGLGKRFARMWEWFLSDADSKDASEVRRVTVEGLARVIDALGDEFSVSESSKWGKLLRQIYDGSKAAAVDDYNAKHGNGQAAQAPTMGDALPGEPVETPKWRMRVAVLRNLSSVAKRDKAYALALWTGALADEAHEVRIAAGDVLLDLAADGSGVGGVAGVLKDYVPALLQFWKRAREPGSANFQRRIVAVHAAAVSSKIPALFDETRVIVAESFADPVSNVVLATLGQCAKNPACAKAFKDKLAEMAKSSEPDVAGFAEIALKAGA